MSDSLKSGKDATEKFKDTIAKKHGMIIAEGPNGEVWECRSLREAMERTGVHRSTIDYAIKHGTAPKGWRFERDATNQS